MGMKSSKWPVTYVLDHNFWLGRHTTFPFAFADSYDPNGCLSYRSRTLRGCRKIFQSPRSECTHLKKLYFLRFTVHFTFKWSWKLKNDRSLTFLTITFDWDVMRPSRLLSQIHMILTSVSNTEVAPFEDVERFFRAFEVSALNWKNSTF